MTDDKQIEGTGTDASGRRDVYLRAPIAEAEVRREIDRLNAPR